MKFIRTFLPCLIIFLSILGTSHAQAIDSLKTGLVGYWKFDEIDSTNLTVSDESGNNNTGLIGPGVHLSTGKFGLAAKFDDGLTTQYMTTGGTFSSPTWSISTWVNPTTPFIKTAPYNGLNAIFSTDPPRQLLGIQKDGVYMYLTKITDFDFEKNPGWHHIVFTYDGTTLSAIVDNAYKGSIPYKNLMAVNSKRYIGVNSPTTGYHMFRGLMDEFRLYNRTLTSQEISTLYSVPPTSLLSSFSASTNKASYNPQETITMQSSFVMSPDWVSYLNTLEQNQAEVQFTLKDADSTILVNKSFAFTVNSNTITNTFDFTIPNSNVFIGKTLTFEVSVFNTLKTINEKKVVGTVSIGSTSTQTTRNVSLRITKQNTAYLGDVAVLLDAPQTLYSYGDSITVGALATSIAKRYPNLIASALGLPLINMAVNGSILEEAGQIDNIYAQNVDDTSISTFMTGYNNHRYYGTNTVNLDTYKKALPVALAYLSIPNNKKIFGTSLTTTGAWTATTTYNMSGKSISTRTASSTAVATVEGTTVYVAGTRIDARNKGSVTIFIDGINKGSYSCSGVTPSFTAKRTYAPFMARFNGLQSGPHTVQIVSDNNGYCEINWVAGNANLTAFPRVYVGGALLMTADRYTNNSPKGSVAANTMYNQVINDTRNMLAADGLNVVTSPTEIKFNPNTMFSTDNVHPNDLGHQTLANAFINSVLSDTYKLKEGTSVRLIALPINSMTPYKWAGCDNQQGNICRILMNGDRSVGIEFTPF